MQGLNSLVDPLLRRRPCRLSAVVAQGRQRGQLLAPMPAPSPRHARFVSPCFDDRCPAARSLAVVRIMGLPSRSAALAALDQPECTTTAHPDQRARRAPPQAQLGDADASARWMKAAPSRPMNSRSPRVGRHAAGSPRRGAPRARRSPTTVMPAQHQGDADEEQRRRQGPRHPLRCRSIRLLLTRGPGRSPWRCSCGRTR